jgi:hypothetical protein
MTRMTSLADGRSLIVSAWAEEAFPWQALTLVDGELPFAADTPTAAIGEGLAERYGLEVGQTIELFQSEFRIVGIVGARSVLARNLVMILLGDAQRLSFREGQATSISIRLDPDAPAEAHRQTIERLQATFPAYAVDETEKLASGYTFARIADVLAKAISIVAFASAVFAIFNTMSMSVHERRGEIAIMSAVGWPRRRIVVYIVVEGMLLTTVAGIAGARAWRRGGAFGFHHADDCRFHPPRDQRHACRRGGGDVAGDRIGRFASAGAQDGFAFSRQRIARKMTGTAIPQERGAVVAPCNAESCRHSRSRTVPVARRRERKSRASGRRR